MSCVGIIAQGFLCSGSLSTGTQLELTWCCTTKLLIFIKSEPGLCYRKPRVEPEGGGGSLRVSVCLSEGSKREPVSLLELPATKILCSQQLKVSGGVYVILWVV